MELLYFPPARDGAGRILLVMLPGVNDVPESFERYGVLAALRAEQGQIDVVAADAHKDYYLDQTLLEILEREVVEPARRRGYERIWFLGVSLGGMGCLLYAREHPEALEGVILLAPYLGASGTVSGVLRQGGLARWHPEGPLEPDDDRVLLSWLAEHARALRLPTRLYLGCGRQDRFKASSALIAELLPSEQTVFLEGGHDWGTWSRLWSGILALGPFDRSRPTARD